MDLARLLATLEPLCADVDDRLGDIAALLDRGRDLAEYEVARFYVARALGDRVERDLGNVDPRRRVTAIDLVRLIYPRAEAARVLRRVYKDPDPTARSRARRAAHELGLDDVALPDTLTQPRPWVSGSPRIGDWNRTGWSFGLYRAERRRPAHAATRRSVLGRLGLPRLEDADDVARLVGLADRSELARHMRPGHGPGAPYVEFEIAKASGGTRRISAPRHALKAIQRTLLAEILARLPVHDACHGFVPGRSTVTNAAPHLGARVVVKMDLRDFFPSVHYRRVVGLFGHYGYNHDVARILAGLTTHRPVLPDGRVAWPGALPQGAPTSPALANLVCRRLDLRLTGLADKLGARYTRYADDLTFSFADEPACPVGRFCWWIDQICQQEGFVENSAKRRILRPGNQQRVTGIVVNSQLAVPRSSRRRFRAILANCRRHGLDSQARGRSDFADYLRGYAAYVKMVQPALGDALLAEVEAILAAERGSVGA